MAERTPASRASAKSPVTKAASTAPEKVDAKRGQESAERYRTPNGASATLSWRSGSAKRAINAVADWMLLRDQGVPTAEMFHVAYLAEPSGGWRDPRRPITFLFNGGPGAASAFLHMGTAGPRRITFTKNGRTLPPPVEIVDNAESWLDLTDLVFVDPIGTGLSRTVSESRLEQHGLEVEDDKRERRTKELPDARKGYYKIKRDIDSLCEFVSAFLSKWNRWESPVAIAGESYGGFRVGKLVRALPERGVAVNAAMLISPAIDFLGINGSDYDILTWTNLVPPMALAARHHGKSRGRFASLAPTALRQAAERFAETDLATHLLRGDRASASERQSTLDTLADLIGLPPSLVHRCNGRVGIERFARELLRDEGLVCGLYDAAITGPDVFPDREGGANPDPTLGGLCTAFTAGVNAMVRGEIGLRTDREYLLVNDDVWKLWADDRASGYWDRQLECADDLRYGMAMNPDLRVLIAHGWYDLVTTYASSEQTVANLRLPPGLRERIRLRNYDGGHMFYTWEASRKAVHTDVGEAIKGR